MTPSTRELQGKNAVVEFFHFMDHQYSCLEQILPFHEAHMFLLHTLIVLPVQSWAVTHRWDEHNSHQAFLYVKRRKKRMAAMDLILTYFTKYSQDKIFYVYSIFPVFRVALEQGKQTTNISITEVINNSVSLWVGNPPASALQRHVKLFSIINCL